jgi:hypothetical protein
MERSAELGGGRRASRWRVTAWAAAALVLLVPLVAMEFTPEVNWNAGDFLFAGGLLLGVGVPLELAVRKTRNTAYRVAVGLALVAAFLLVWLNGAVGIIGSEDNEANVMYAGVLAVALGGSLIALFRAGGMARAMTATAVAQALVAVAALVIQWGYPWSELIKTLAANGFFFALFVASARLFREAALHEVHTAKRPGTANTSD